MIRETQFYFLMSKAIKKSILKLFLYLRENNSSCYKKLEKWEFLSQSNLKLLQMERLKKLILHSYHHVPYYRELLRSSGVIDNSGFVKLDKFENIPLLDKKSIHYNFENLKSDDLNSRKWYENASGGSTGQPIRLIQDDEYANWRSAVKILYDRWTGCKFNDRKLLLWGSERDLFFGNENWRIRFGRWLRNEVWFNAFRMTRSNMDNCVNTINSFKPVQILSYVEIIYELSRFIKRNRLEIFSPNAIMSTAGTLYPQFRKTIEEALNAPVFNRYGSREVGDIACECDRHKGLHVSAPIHYVEILKKNGEPAKPGEVGEIVITLLTNFAMPLIRYRIGDMGVWSDETCSCGCNWPLLKRVTGRVTDVFFTINGEMIDGEYFTHLLYFKNWIQKFQVVQEDYDSIRFIIIPYEIDSTPDRTHQNELDEIISKVRLVMGKSCQVKFKFVDDIEKTSSGKYKYVISKVAKAWN